MSKKPYTCSFCRFEDDHPVGVYGHIMDRHFDLRITYENRQMVTKFVQEDLVNHLFEFMNKKDEDDIETGDDQVEEIGNTIQVSWLFYN